MRDNIYNSTTDLVDFCFNSEVVKVFDDMVKRSVPGYLNTLETIRLIAKNYGKQSTNLYDLGCSTGATATALNINNHQIIAIDNSISMIEECQKKFHNFSNIKFAHNDILNADIKNASVVVLNLTLQFINKEDRQKLIDKIYNGMVDGGALFISEKIHFLDKNHNIFMNNLHLQFKKSNGYSDLEIANKRQLLENILVTDDEMTHLNRFKKSGFKNLSIILQNINFYGFIAIK